MSKYNHDINGVIVPFTAEEEAERDAEIQAWNDGSAEREAAQNKIEADKVNANAKLKALGLTDDEIKAIKGIV